MSKQKAFTLIEVLIVILIIGTLTAIAVPTFKGMAIKAKLTEMLEGVHTRELDIDLQITEKGWDTCLTWTIEPADTPDPALFYYNATKFVGVGVHGRWFGIMASVADDERRESYSTLCEKRIYEDGFKKWSFNNSHPWTKYLKEILPKEE